MLSQVKDGWEQVAAYYSAKLRRPERNYCVTWKELLAAVKALERFHPYLHGAQFIIRADHAALRWLRTLKLPEIQLARWLSRLEQYDYRAEYHRVCIHNNADNLLRHPCESGYAYCTGKKSDPVCRRLRALGDADEGDSRWKRAQLKNLRSSSALA